MFTVSTSDLEYRNSGLGLFPLFWLVVNDIFTFLWKFLKSKILVGLQHSKKSMMLGFSHDV